MPPKCFKFTFFALVDSLNLSLKFPCTISIIWKRGEKLAEVKERRGIVNGVATFKQQLAIECNMIFDPEKKLFESKKTIFSILIFTDKGTKQAGEIEIDVAELLNNKQECKGELNESEKAYQSSLLKCPDKNAKLTFTIRPSFKEEIKPDAVSERSLKTVDVEKVAGTINISEANFKKKRRAPEDDSSSNRPIIQTKNTRTETHISFTEEDVKQLAEENKRLKEGVKESKKEIDKIKKSIENSEAIASEQKKKCEGYEAEINRLKKVSKDFSDIQEENKVLENEVLISKLKLAEIFNKAFELGGPNLVDVLQEACGYVQNPN